MAMLEVKDTALLEVKNIDVFYGSIQALRGVSLHVNPGEIVALLGANGAGKSTTLRTISGLIAPKKGTITFNHQNIHGLPAHEVVCRGITHGPEGRALLGPLSVEENLRFGYLPALRASKPKRRRHKLINPKSRTKQTNLNGHNPNGHHHLTNGHHPSTHPNGHNKQINQNGHHHLMDLNDHNRLMELTKPRAHTYRERLDYVFFYFPRLKERMKQPAGTLSGGEQQMLVMARALMSTPKLLIMDELSLGLAPKMVNTLFEVIRDVNREGTAVLIVEQFVHLALQNTDRAYVLAKGEVVLQGQSRDLLDKEEHLMQAYLGTPAHQPPT